MSKRMVREVQECQALAVVLNSSLLQVWKCGFDSEEAGDLTKGRSKASSRDEAAARNKQPPMQELSVQNEVQDETLEESQGLKQETTSSSVNIENEEQLHAVTRRGSSDGPIVMSSEES